MQGLSLETLNSVLLFRAINDLQHNFRALLTTLRSLPKHWPGWFEALSQMRVRTYHTSFGTSIQDFLQADVACGQSYDGGLVRRIFWNPRDDSSEQVNILILVLASCLSRDSGFRLLLFVSE